MAPWLIAMAVGLMLGACARPGGGVTASDEPEEALPSRVDLAKAPLPVAGQPACTDADARADALRRLGEIEVDKSLDLDGDGQLEPIYASCSMAVGMRCQWQVYRRDGACLVFAGELNANLGGPWCGKEPAVNGGCVLHAMRDMLHGDAQEYVFEFIDGVYVETRAGDKYVPAPPHGKR